MLRSSLSLGDMQKEDENNIDNVLSASDSRLMTDKHKEAITTNFENLVVNLTVGETLLCILVTERIISVHELQQLSAMTDASVKAR